MHLLQVRWNTSSNNRSVKKKQSNNEFKIEKNNWITKNAWCCYMEICKEFVWNTAIKYTCVNSPGFEGDILCTFEVFVRYLFRVISMQLREIHLKVKRVDLVVPLQHVFCFLYHIPRWERYWSVLAIDLCGKNEKRKYNQKWIFRYNIQLLTLIFSVASVCL